MNIPQNSWPRAEWQEMSPAAPQTAESPFQVLAKQSPESLSSFPRRRSEPVLLPSSRALEPLQISSPILGQGLESFPPRFQLAQGQFGFQAPPQSLGLMPNWHLAQRRGSAPFPKIPLQFLVPAQTSTPSSPDDPSDRLVMEGYAEVAGEMADEALGIPEIFFNKIAVKLIIEEAMQWIQDSMDHDVVDYENGDVFEYVLNTMVGIVKVMQQDGSINSFNDIFEETYDPKMMPEFRNAVKCQLAENPEIQTRLREVKEVVAADLGSALSFYVKAHHTSQFREEVLLCGFLHEVLEEEEDNDRKVIVFAKAIAILNENSRVQELMENSDAMASDFQALKNLKSALIAEWDGNSELRSEIQGMQETFQIALEESFDYKFSHSRQIECQNFALMFCLDFLHKFSKNDICKRRFMALAAAQWQVTASTRFNFQAVMRDLLKNKLYPQLILNGCTVMLKNFEKLVKTSQDFALSEQQIRSRNSAVCCILDGLREGIQGPLQPPALEPAPQPPTPKFAPQEPKDKKQNKSISFIFKILMMDHVLSRTMQQDSCIEKSEQAASVSLCFDHKAIQALFEQELNAEDIIKLDMKPLSELIKAICCLFDAVVEEGAPDLLPKQVKDGNKAIVTFVDTVIGEIKKMSNEPYFIQDTLMVSRTMATKSPAIALNYQKMHSLFYNALDHAGARTFAGIPEALGTFKSAMRRIFPPPPKPVPVAVKLASPKAKKPKAGGESAMVSAPTLPPAPPLAWGPAQGVPAMVSPSAFPMLPPTPRQETQMSRQREAHRVALARKVISFEGGVFSLSSGAAHMYHNVVNADIKDGICAYVSSLRRTSCGQMKLAFEDRIVEISFSDSKEFSRDAKLHIKSIKLSPPLEGHAVFIPEESEGINRHEEGRFIKVSQSFRRNLDRMMERPPHGFIDVNKWRIFVDKFLFECTDSKNENSIQGVNKEGSHCTVRYRVGDQSKAFGLWLTHGGDRVRLSSKGILNALEVMSKICYVPEEEE
ncbi:MAG: hypothetical protein LBJ94_02680 [Puniceicoccales bacterium]|jgi:hypothetical protein|nr:hypothetical protein [Puniceicoccales bacterium]